MYNRALRVGRVGYEVQYRLLVDPWFLIFDRQAKKLGTKLDFDRCRLEHDMPRRWTWVADPTSGTCYIDDDEPARGRLERWFISDHHQRFKDSVGYNSYRTYPESKRVFYQLELVSEPLEQTYDVRAYHRDVRRIYNRNLVEMLDMGVAGCFPGTEDKQLGIVEQINLELHNEQWRHNVDPTRKMMCLALGLFLLTRYREQLETEPHMALLLEHFDTQTALNTTLVARYDLISNVRLLLDAWMAGHCQSVSWRWFRRWLTSPIHIAILAQCLDNLFCTYYFHGLLTIDERQMRTLSPRDFQVWRELGIDSLFLDIFADEAQPHLKADLLEKYRFDFLKQSLEHFCPMAEIRQFVRATVLGQGQPEVPRITLPLFHLRKNLSPGCIYLELRDVEAIKLKRSGRYRYAYKELETRDGEVRVVGIRHLHQLGLDIAELFEIAIVAGDALLRQVLADDEVIKSRDRSGLQRQMVPLLNYLFRCYRRPLWPI
ncbi:MAG: hypothetical protein HN348_04600 [Proteobacteria bacterium]|nr:hypothetical protein [Pseudomonadota bacterium]